MNDFTNSWTWKLGVQIRQSFDGSFGRILFRHCIEESPTESPLLVTFSGTEFPKHYLLNSFRLRETIQSRTKLRLLQRPCDLPVVDFSMVLATSPFRFKWRRIFSFKIAIQDYQAFALPMNDGTGKSTTQFHQYRGLGARLFSR
jgi:hypothetical protein